MSSPSAHFYVRTSVAIAGAVVSLLLAGRWILKRPADQVTVGHVIAFDAVAFIIAGFAFVISASERWSAACLWAGAALFGGGLLGFLFGLPASPPTPPAATAPPASGADGKTASATAAAPTSATQIQQNHNLLKQATGWLSTLLAGATFARYQDVLKVFKDTSKSIGNYVLVSPGNYAGTLGGGILLYFGLLGFCAASSCPSIFCKHYLGYWVTLDPQRIRLQKIRTSASFRNTYLPRSLVPGAPCLRIEIWAPTIRLWKMRY